MTPAAAAAAGGRKRRPYRRDQILDAAIELFFKHGYHVTGMDDIGNAAGITGPGIYRHFKNKEDILQTAVTQAADQILGRVHEIVEHVSSPEEALHALIRNFIRALLNKPSLAGLLINQRRVFPQHVRAGWDRADRLHMSEWLHALEQLRPDLTEAERRLRVSAASGLLASAASAPSHLERDRLEDLLEDMAFVALVGSPDQRAKGKRAVRLVRLRPS